MTFRWQAMDVWYEEAEQVHVHARDTRKWVDVRASTRHVGISLDGLVLANSDRLHLGFFETDLPQALVVTTR